MKIFITTHGDYEWNHISLCTTDFEKAVTHFLEYSKTTWYNCSSCGGEDQRRECMDEEELHRLVKWWHLWMNRRDLIS